MDHDELERWCFLFASTAARQDVTIAVLRAVIAKSGLINEGHLKEIEELAMEQSFRVRRGRYERMLKAFWLEQSPEAALRAWMEDLRSLQVDPPTSPESEDTDS